MGLQTHSGLTGLNWIDGGKDGIAIRNTAPLTEGRIYGTSAEVYVISE